jgi:Tol biopolymer transport system component
MIRRWLTIASIIVLSGLIAFLKPHTLAAVDCSEYTVMYLDDPLGNTDIFVVSLETGSTTNITMSSENELNPDWSPDGSRIAFARQDENQSDIYVMDRNGSNVTNLTNTEFFREEFPVWSPDGSKIAFIYDDGEDRDIYVFDFLDDTVRNLSNDDLDNYLPVWSTNGDRLAYTANNDQTTNIKVYDFATQLISVGSEQSFDEITDMDWSPVAEILAFSALANGNSDIFILNLSSGTALNLSRSPELDYGPRWSVDGTVILFWTNEMMNFEIYSISNDTDAGITTNNLTKSNYNETGPTWSPDDSYIAFTSNRDGYSDSLYVMDSEGSNVQLVAESALSFTAQWQPCAFGTNASNLRPFST